MSNSAPRLCRECLMGLKPTAAHDAVFCCTPCRTKWNNRRHTRGAELYDLIMVLRFQREIGKELGVWSLVCRIVSIWNEEDKAAGRSTYNSPSTIKTRFVRYAADVLQKWR